MPLFSIYSNSSGETFKQSPMRYSNVVIFYLDTYLLTCYLNAEDFLKSLSSIVKYFEVVSKKYFSLYFTSTKCSLSQSINEICVSCCVLRYGLPTPTYKLYLDGNGKKSESNVTAIVKYF